jgi:acyl-CoA synthetase (AMP-forming)/AMP-acid ligase II
MSVNNSVPRRSTSSIALSHKARVEVNGQFRHMAENIPGCQMKNNLIDVIRSLDSTEERRGIYFHQDAEKEPRFVSYANLHRKICAYASRFREDGVGPGTRVLFPFESDTDVLCAFLALIGMGSLPLSIRPHQRYTSTRGYVEFLREITCHYKPEWVLGVPSLGDLDLPLPRLSLPTIRDASRCEDSLHDPCPESVAFVQLSSGTTGFPKAVPIRHDRCLANIAYILNLDQRPSYAVMSSWLPLYHDMGLVGLLSNMCSMNTMHLYSPAGYLMDALRWWSDLSRFRCYATVMPNFGIEYGLRRLRELDPADTPDLDLSHLEFIYVGSDLINVEIIDEFCKRLATAGLARKAFKPCYGMSEAVLVVSCDGLEKEIRTRELGSEKLVCVGQVLPSFEIRVVADDGSLAEDGQLGEVQLRGGTLADGYFASSLPFYDDEGFYSTGDLGLLFGRDLYIAGRTGDRIKINGQSYFASAFERIIENLPFTVSSRTAVIQHGERIIVLAELRRAEVSTTCQQQRGQIVEAIMSKMGVKIFPENVRFVRSGQLPKTSSGKLRRHAIARAYLQGNIREWTPETKSPSEKGLSHWNRL